MKLAKRKPIAIEDVGPVHFARLKGNATPYNFSADVKEAENKIVVKINWCNWRTWTCAIPLSEWPAHPYDQLNYVYNALGFLDEDPADILEETWRSAEGVRDVINKAYPRPEAMSKEFGLWLYQKRPVGAELVYNGLTGHAKKVKERNAQKERA